MKTDTRRTKDAVYVVDDLYMQETNHLVPSGYDLDARGAKYSTGECWKRGYDLETDDSLDAPATLSRRFMPIREGKAGLNFIFAIKRGDGFFIEFLDDCDKVSFTLQQKNGLFYWNDTALPVEASKKLHSMNVEFDIDKKEAKVAFGGKYCGTYKVLTDNIARYLVGYRNGAKGGCFLKQTHLHLNYVVNDRNEVHEDGNLFYNWIVDTTEGAKAFTSYYYEGTKFFTNVICASGGAETKCRREFDKLTGKVCFEIKYLTKNTSGEGIKLSLTSDGKEILSFFDDGTALMSQNGAVLRKHNPYVWQTFRVIADTDTKTAEVYLNGKKCGLIDFDVDSFDGISVSYAPENDGVMKFTDVFVYIIQPEPEDYPKPPVLPEKDDRYVTGMNICSLWRNGEHVGWDAISAFKENITYLGFYDEGLPETADWEIKWMAEHGLDCEFYCWYCRQTKAPNFNTALSAAIHDGHFKAKYADYMKLALIWEAGAGSPASPKDVEDYYIPYFEDYFFSDPRYLSIDGVAIMSVYNIEKVARDLGGYDKVKEVMELLRASAKRCGFRDLAIITCGEPSENRKIADIDGIYAYGWGHYGYEPTYQMGRIKSQMDMNLLHVVPTVSVGYNDVAWRKSRHPMISCEDMGKVIEWFKDDILPSYSHFEEEWKKKLMMFSTWNEYGEGTYICPSNLNGFGYLNEMRKAVTKNADAFESDRPSQASLDRISYLYPKGRELLSALLNTKPEVPTKVVCEYKYDTPESVDKWEGVNLVELCFKDNRVCGYGNTWDPQIITDVDFDAEGVDAISLKIATGNANYPINRERPEASSVEIFFMREGDENFSGKRMLNIGSSAEDMSLVFFTKDCPEWSGRITKIRIDPTYSAGSFEIENIKALTFNDGKIRYKTFVDGKEFNCHYRTKVEDGKFYVSFEPLRHFPILTKIYYEWDAEDKTLMIKSYHDKVSYWTIGKDTAIIDGKEVKLSKQLEMFEGLPYLPLDEFCAATGCSYEVSDDVVSISTNI